MAVRARCFSAAATSLAMASLWATAVYGQSLGTWNNSGADLSAAADWSYTGFTGSNPSSLTSVATVTFLISNPTTLPTTMSGPMSINGLTFSGVNSTVSIGGNTGAVLTLNNSTGGFNVLSSTGAINFQPSIVIGASQNWTNNDSAGLTLGSIQLGPSGSTTNRTLTFGGSGATTISGTLANSGANVGTFAYYGTGSLAITGNVAIGGALTVTNSGLVTISGNISNSTNGGAAALNYGGSGALTLSGTNSYSGATALTGSGTIYVGASNAFGTGNLVVGNAATNGVTIQSFGTNPVVFGNSTATFTSYGATSITLSGTSILDFSSTNVAAASATLNITAPGVKFGSIGIDPSGTASRNAAWNIYAGSAVTFAGTITPGLGTSSLLIVTNSGSAVFSGTVAPGGATTFSGPGTTTISGSITNATTTGGGVTSVNYTGSSSSTIAISGANNNYTGPTAFRSTTGALVILSSDHPFGYGDLLVNNTNSMTIQTTGTSAINLLNSSIAFNYGSNVTFTGTAPVNLSSSPIITASATLNINVPTMTFGNIGTAYSSSVTRTVFNVSSGSTAVINGALTAGTYSGAVASVSTINNSGSFIVAGSIANGSTNTINGPGNMTISGVVADASSGSQTGILFAGTGALTMSSGNAYSGNTTLAGTGSFVYVSGSGPF
ncbi:MAG TPA: hypothetical protein VG713_14170, partial [Pirellulales bacterium]|nr:hypothetical protein [Pirellulales bacterium]